MPDKRRHRGPHPDDARLFAATWHDALRAAVAELSWLLSRGYAPDSGLKLVGDRHGLTARQRVAVRRSACPDPARAARLAKRRTLATCAGQSLAVDGYNVLITVESALSGGVVLIGRDGACRDLASIHGTYRRVGETLPAFALIVDEVDRAGLREVRWYLDAPVSNSGRLKALLADALERRAPRAAWSIELHARPDAVLAAGAEPVGTSDSVVLDACRGWVDVAAEVIHARTPDAWIVDLRDDRPDAGVAQVL